MSLTLNGFKALVRTNYMRLLGWYQTFRPYVATQNSTELVMTNQFIVPQWYHQTNVAYGYLYIPRYVRCDLRSSSKPGQILSYVGEAILSTELLVWPDGSVLPSGSGIQIDWVYETNLFTTDVWNGFDLKACQGEYNVTILGEQVAEFTPQSQACDTKMVTYCDGKTATQNPECSCLINNSIKYSVNDDEIFLPVTCFNRECYQNGYRTAEMSREVCSATQCEAISESSTSNQTLYCAGSYYGVGSKDIEKKDDDIDTPDSQQNASNVPTTFTHTTYYADIYAWIGGGLLLLASLIMLFYFVKKL